MENAGISYQKLRLAIGFLGLALPILVCAETQIVGKCHCLQDSISHYYYTAGNSFFVGILWGLGLVLLFYPTYKNDPKDVSITECEKCAIEVYPKEIIKSDTKFCSFDVGLSIANNSGNTINATIVAPNNDVVIIPSGFSIVTGTSGYHFNIIPIGNFTGGTVHLQIKGLTKEGQPCITDFSIDLPSCIRMEGKNNMSVQGTDETKFSVIMAPNPAKEEVTIAYTGLDSNTTIELLDLTGRSINTSTVTEANGSVTILTHTYPAGIYIVLVQSNGNIVAQQKLIIE